MSKVNYSGCYKTNDSKTWYLDGEFHRLDGPARIWPDGAEQWWQNGKLHRLDGPAYIDPNGHKAWLLNDKFHRLDGPARIWSDGQEEWWVDGHEIVQEELDWLTENNIPFEPSLRTIEQTILHRLRWI